MIAVAVAATGEKIYGKGLPYGGRIDYNKPQEKKGRPPGIRWRTPTYVTELVGYL